MSWKIVSTGRGGTGKTTFTALITRYLSPPLLLIDIDPDQNLADMLGIELEKQKVRTVSDALYDIQMNTGYEELGSMTLPDKVNYLLQRECLYEGDDFDLITLGAKWTEGCYCAPDDLLRATIPKLAKNYATVVMDSPAGLEHLNRKVISDIDDLFVLSDPSAKSVKHIKRIKNIAREINVVYSHFYVVGNYEFDRETEEYLRDSDETYLGKLDYDAQVKEYNLKGKTLLDLPEDSPACVSAKRILDKAGYKIEGVKVGG